MTTILGTDEILTMADAPPTTWTCSDCGTAIDDQLDACPLCSNNDEEERDPS